MSYKDKKQKKVILSVPASPFNPLKLDCVISLIIGLLLLLLINQLLPTANHQLIALLAYGLGMMVWLIVRARRLMLRYLATDCHG